MMRPSLMEEDGCLLHLGEPILAICEKYGKSYCASCFRQGLAKCLSPESHCKYRSRCLVVHYNSWMEQAREKREALLK